MADFKPSSEVMKFLDEACHSQDFKLVYGGRKYSPAEIKRHVEKGSLLGRRLYEKAETLYYARQYYRKRGMQENAMKSQSDSYREN